MQKKICEYLCTAMCNCNSQWKIILLSYGSYYCPSPIFIFSIKNFILKKSKFLADLYHSLQFVKRIFGRDDQMDEVGLVLCLLPIVLWPNLTSLWPSKGTRGSGRELRCSPVLLISSPCLSCLSLSWSGLLTGALNRAYRMECPLLSVFPSGVILTRILVGFPVHELRVHHRIWPGACGF